MNENLNKILGELEEDLKNLQSARKQVESVVLSNTEFANSANSLVNNTQKFVEVITKSTNDAVDGFVVTVREVSNLAKSSLEEQKNENLKVLNHLLETQNQIKQLIGQLLDLNLPNTLKSINSNLEIIQKQNQNQLDILKNSKLLLIIGFGVISLLIIILKFAV
ncbi:MAG: hypothetical protein KBA52_08290 [Candidatus Kapabacteria bacterium]|nr:hypothetical protein [Candidatus Kapabacteria bacterium]